MFSRLFCVNGSNGEVHFMNHKTALNKGLSKIREARGVREGKTSCTFFVLLRFSIFNEKTTFL